MILLWNIPLTQLGVFKPYLKLWLAQRRGSIRRLLRSEWIPPVFWLIASAGGVWLVEQLQHFNSAKAGAVFHGWTTQTVGAILAAIASEIFGFLIGIWSQWLLVATVYVIITILLWALQARKRVIIEEFVDYTHDEARDDKTKSAVDGLATLLVVRLGRLRDLYRAVDEQRAIPTSVWVNQSIDATIDVGNITEFLKDAVSAQSEFSLGPLKIPVGTLLSFLGHVVQGPRIIGSLHKDKDLLILTAQRVDSKQSLSWQVEGPIPAEQPGELENDSLKSMAEELAFRMFTDLSLSGSVRWRATAKFSEGLRAYRECLRSPKDRKVNLELAEKKFIEALAEDQKFDLAYYNLGVVYTELGQTKAAESAFMDAICQNHASWNAYYALAMIRLQSAKEAQEHARSKIGQDRAKHENAIFRIQYESVVGLCSRVIDLRPEMANLAKAYQLKAQAQDQLFELTHEDQKAASKSRRKAIGYSWKALCRAELRKQGLRDSEKAEIGQLETLASICLANQAEAHLKLAEKLPPTAHQAEARRRPRNLERAETLLHQALSLNHSDPDYYAYYHYELGETYFELGRTDKLNLKEYLHKAVCQYEQAIRIIPERADFWASLALVYTSLGDKENALDACEKVLDYAPFASNEILGRAFSKTTKVPNLLKDEPETRRRIGVMQGFLEKQKEISEVVEAWKDGEYTVDSFVKELESKLAKFDTDTNAGSGKDSNEDNEDRAWGYALVALELGNLDATTAKAQGLEEHLKHNDYETGYAQGFLSLGNLDANDARLRKVTEYHHKAIEQLEAVLNQPGPERDDWERGQIQRVLGLLYLDLGKPDKAEDCFREAIKNLEKKLSGKIKPYKLRVLFTRALLAQDKQEKTLQALQEVKQALAVGPLDHREREVLGDVHFRLKEFDRAVRAWQDALLWRNALLREPATPTLYYKIGNAHVELARHCFDLSLRKKELQEAVGYLKRALDLYRSDQKEQKGLTCYLLGTIHIELGEYREAIAYLRLSQMFEFAPLTSTFKLGYAYLKNREYDESFRQFESLLKDNSQWKIQNKPINVVVEADPRVHISVMQGEILALAKWGKATAYAERDVNLPDALNLIKDAQQHIDELQQKKPGAQLLFSAGCKGCLGWVYFKLGEFDEAIKCLKDALILAAHAETYLRLALVHESQMQLSKDIAEIESLLKQVRIYCQHVQELDINREWDQQVKDLLLRLQEKSQEVQQMKVQGHE